MFYPGEIIEDVRASNDIVNVISTYIKLQKRGNSHLGLCPFHNEKTPSFSVSQSKQLYHCFGCGVGGNVFTFIMEYENYSYIEAIEHLAIKAGINLPEREYTEQERRTTSLKERLYEVNKVAATYFFYQLRTKRGAYAYNYLVNRGISKDIIQSFGLGFSNQISNDLYTHLKSKGYEDDFLKITGLVNYDEKRGSTDKFWNRIIFPIQDSNNRIIGFGGRVVGDAMPKYLNSPETLVFDKSKNLYGINYARKSREDYIIICEGYLDVMALHQGGFTSAVASLGTAFTPQQALLIKRYTRDVYLVYDSDNAGIKAALRAIAILEETNISAKVVDLKPYKDPDDFLKALGSEEFKKRIEEARSSFFFEIDVLANSYNMDKPEEKTKFFSEVARKLTRFKEELERNIYIESIAKEYNVDYLHLQRLVNRIGSNIKPVETYGRENKIEVKAKAEQSIEKAQKLLLTWLIEKKDIFNIVKDIIEPKDFIEGIYFDVANHLFNEYIKGNRVEPAKIINNFESMEEQKLVASLFTADLQVEMEDSEFEKALRDIIITIKGYSLERQSTKAIEDNNIELLQKTIIDKANLDKINIRLREEI